MGTSTSPGCDEHYLSPSAPPVPAFRPELTFVCEADGALAGQITHRSLQLHPSWRWARIWTPSPSVPWARPLPPFRERTPARAPGVPCPCGRPRPWRGTGRGDLWATPRPHGAATALVRGERWGHLPGDRPSTRPASRQWSWPPAPWQTPPGASARAWPMPPTRPRWALWRPFLVKEKAITDFQQGFQVMCSLGSRR